MRTFIVIKDGAARIMRTYALGPGGRAITPDVEDVLSEVTPAPHATDVIAKWHPAHQAAVISFREISESDIPADTTFKDAWEDDGATITVDMPKARAVHALRMARAKITETARLVLAEVELRLLGKATEADQAAADKAVVDGLNLATLATQMAAAPNPTALSAIWPARVPRP